jgi:uncharacterized iron-regulated membrane protein
MKAFRTLVFWLHLCTGVTVGTIVLIMALTGVLLTYEKQLTRWADTRGLNGAPPTAGAPRLDVATLVGRARSASPGRPTAVTWRSGADAPVEVAFGRERTLFLNAYTGEVLGDGSSGVRSFFRTVTDWHRWLGRSESSRPWGKGIADAANLGFFCIVLSGIYLWWPRNWARDAVRSVITFRRGLAGKARDFNWHNVIGLWSWAPLVIIVFSGVMISYGWANRLVYGVFGEKPPAVAPAGAPGSAAGGAPGATSSAPSAERRGGGGPMPSLGGVDALVARAGQRVPSWRSLTLALPASDTAKLSFQIDRGMGGEPHKRAELVLDRTGAEVRWQPFSSLTPGRRTRSILRFAHTGEVLGVVGQTIAGIVSLGISFLVYTGLALTLRRFVSWRRRKERRAAATRGAPARV